MFVGTHADQVSKEEFQEKDKLLQNKIKHTESFDKTYHLCEWTLHLSVNLSFQVIHRQIGPIHHIVAIGFAKIFGIA